MTNINIDFLTDISHDCARAMLNFDSLNEDAIDFYISMSEIIRAISSLIEKYINGNKGSLIDPYALRESIESVLSFGIDIDFDLLLDQI